MGKRNRERKARIEAGLEEPIAPRKEPEKEEPGGADELTKAMEKLEKLSRGPLGGH